MELLVLLLLVSKSSSFQASPTSFVLNHRRSSQSVSPWQQHPSRKHVHFQVVRRQVLMGHPADLVDVHSLSTQAAAASQILLQYLKPSLDAYATLLRDKPVETKSTTAAVLALAGDAIAQSRSDAEEYDVKRGAAFLMFGALYTGAFQHNWFEYLNNHIAHWGVQLGAWGEPAVKTEWWRFYDLYSRLLASLTPSSSHAVVLPPPPDATLAAAKVAVNQFGMVPFIYMPLFFAMTGALGQLSPTESLERGKELYLPLLQRNWLFWLPTQFFQFLVLPPDFQIPFLCCASLCWTVILSSIGTTPSSPAPLAAAVAATIDDPSNSREEPDQSQLALRAVGGVNELTDSVSFRDVTNAAAGFVPDAVSDALEGAAGVISDATVAGGLGLLASTSSDANIGAAVGGILAESGEVGEFLLTGFGGSTGQAEFGIAAVSVISAGVGALVRATDNSEVNDNDGYVFSGTAVNSNDTDMINEKTGHDVEGFANITVS